MGDVAIPHHNVVAFGRNLQHVPQSMQARLIDCVDSDMNFTEPGEYFTDEQLGKSDPTLVIDRFGDTPNKFVDRERRGAYFYAYEDANNFDKVDKIRQLVDPDNPTVEAMRFGVRRSRDNFIIAGLLGTVRTGKTLENSVALPGGQIDTTAGALTITKLRTASALLDESEVEEVDGQVERYWVGGTADKTSLLATTEVTSADYNTVKALVDGKIDTFMGFKFKWYPNNRIPLTAGGRRKNVAWIKRAGVYRARPIVGGENAKLMERPDKKGNWTAYLSFDQAFMRRFDTGVVEVDCG
jgi:hypothetical protein